MRYLFASAALMIVGPVIAQDLSKVEITTEQVAPGVAVLFGAGGNIGVSYGEDGTILIDDQFAPLTEKIKTAVAALGAQPVKFLVNTHWHYDHTGSNENLGKDGVLIMAHDNVRIRMAAGQGDHKPSSKVALPLVTYDEGLKLHLNGEEVRVMHMSPAHTDGDSIVYWTKSNVIHMGDLFFLKMSFPFVDASSGGNVRGVVTGADKVLALANDQTKIIPGHGPVATKADLQQYRDMVAQIIAKVETGIKAGKTLAQIQAERPADGYGVKADGFITADRFVETVFNMVK